MHTSRPKTILSHLISFLIAVSLMGILPNSKVTN